MMNRCILAFLLTAAWTARLGAQAKHAPSFEEQLSLRTLSGPRISPDGRYIAYRVRPAEERKIQDNWIRHEALQANNREALLQIEGKETLDRERWLFQFGGELRGRTSWLVFLWDGLTVPEYTLREVFNVKAGLASLPAISSMTRSRAI